MGGYEPTKTFDVYFLSLRSVVIGKKSLKTLTLYLLQELTPTQQREGVNCFLALKIQ